MSLFAEVGEYKRVERETVTVYLPCTSRQYRLVRERISRTSANAPWSRWWVEHKPGKRWKLVAKNDPGFADVQLALIWIERFDKAEYR